MAMLTDPTGAFFGLWQPIGHQGFTVVNEAGAPVYHQLTTRDYGKALDFYRQVSAGTPRRSPTPTNSGTAQRSSTAKRPPQAGGTPNSE
jgi:predicted enzyme related to lactoylglutathione lyase